MSTVDDHFPVCNKQVQSLAIFCQLTISLAAYSSVLNVLDYCSVVIPVTKANAKVDKFNADYKPLNEKDELNWKACKSRTPQTV